MNEHAFDGTGRCMLCGKTREEVKSGGECRPVPRTPARREGEETGRGGQTAETMAKALRSGSCVRCGGIHHSRIVHRSVERYITYAGFILPEDHDRVPK